VQLSGTKKAGIAERLADSDISPDFPASMIKLHSNAYLLMDQEASENL
jgi:6-phosphogluconolactonase/glucosamine-6-phosphate isomerase/deaminase